MECYLNSKKESVREILSIVTPKCKETHKFQNYPYRKLLFNHKISAKFSSTETNVDTFKNLNKCYLWLQNYFYGIKEFIC